jgi:hypothetical protein
MTLFAQKSFIQGLDTELDAAKTPASAYPLLIDGRARKDIIEPTATHLPIVIPEGKIQGVYIAGSMLVIFIAGVAYYADIVTSPTILQRVTGWTTMSITADRIYAEIIPASGNFFSRSGTTELTSNVFNSSIASFPQVLLCFDGDPLTLSAQAIFPSGYAEMMGTYTSWTQDRPNYVPNGILPAIVNNKLFIVSIDRKRVYQSVSGRMTDFMVNINEEGNAGGNADSVSVTVAFNDITAMKPVGDGQILVATLYATYIIVLDYDQTFFGEPYLNPQFLFPIGTLNELSIIDVLQDTAFITQSGIHSFNSVMQSKRESNNAPFGAKVRGILQSPQSDTCAGQHKDYAYFAMNTIFGRGALVYDTIAKTFQAVDLSFGYVKQFANTRVAGAERLFFITYDNKFFEAFAGTSTNPPKLYLGEWTPEFASQQFRASIVDLQFSSVKTSGQVKVSIYADRKLVEETIFDIEVPGYTENVPIPIPFSAIKQCVDVSYAFKNHIRGWKFGVLIDWNFEGNLTDVSVDGSIETADNVSMIQQTIVDSQDFAFVADTGYGAELNPGGSFVDGVAPVVVDQGSYYAFNSNGNGPLVNGNINLTSGIFKAISGVVQVQGTGAKTFTLKNADNFKSVIAAIDNHKVDGQNIWTPAAIIGGGDHSYNSGTLLDVNQGLLPFGTKVFHPCAGNHDYDTNLGTYFFNTLQIPRYYSRAYDFVEFFFYNAGWTTANVHVNSSGITTGATSEPDGNSETSIQAGILRNAISASTRKYKIIIVHTPPYTTDNTYYPGYAALRFLSTVGADAILSGHGHSMERFYIAGFPYFICGTGGKSLGTFKTNPVITSAFKNNTNYGFLAIHSDPLTCTISFVTADGDILDTYAIYA